MKSRKLPACSVARDGASATGDGVVSGGVCVFAISPSSVATESHPEAKDFFYEIALLPQRSHRCACSPSSDNLAMKLFSWKGILSSSRRRIAAQSLMGIIHTRLEPYYNINLPRRDGSTTYDSTRAGGTFCRTSREARGENPCWARVCFIHHI